MTFNCLQQQHLFSLLCNVCMYKKRDDQRQRVTEAERKLYMVSMDNKETNPKSPLHTLLHGCSCDIVFIEWGVLEISVPGPFVQTEYSKPKWSKFRLCSIQEVMETGSGQQDKPRASHRAEYKPELSSQTRCLLYFSFLCLHTLVSHTECLNSTLQKWMEYLLWIYLSSLDLSLSWFFLLYLLSSLVSSVNCFSKSIQTIRYSVGCSVSVMNL